MVQYHTKRLLEVDVLHRILGHTRVRVSIAVPAAVRFVCINAHMISGTTASTVPVDSSTDASAALNWTEMCRSSMDDIVSYDVDITLGVLRTNQYQVIPRQYHPPCRRALRCQL